MINRLLFRNIITWFALVFIQVFLLKNMSFYDLSTPFIYVLFLLILPFKVPTFFQYLIAFGTGMVLDAFYDTSGVHATASVTLIFIRISFINLTLNRDMIDEDSPTLGNMGFKWFAFYALICILGHHLVLFMLEAFKLSEIGYTLLRCSMSVVFTLILILLTEFLFFKKKTR